MEIHVVLFKGIPDAAFYEEKGLPAYLRKHGTSIDRVSADMENNPLPDWEVYAVELKQDKHIAKLRLAGPVFPERDRS